MNDIRHFYLIYPPGLVRLGKEELLEKWTQYFKDQEFLILSTDEGGVLISCPFHSGLVLNHILKCPTRILLRVAEFKARDFPKLFNKISKLPWKDYLLGQVPEVQTASTNSKLFDSRKISKAVIDGVLECYKKQPVKKKYLDLALDPKLKESLPDIYYRSVDDLVTISIDTTGERLHKRGDKLLTGLAPIRESFAALLLRGLTENLDKSQYTLIDPMCGSGTFLIEAHDSEKFISERSFAFEYYPLLLESKEFIAIKNELKTQDLSGQSFISLIGHDINEEVIKVTKINCDQRPIQISQADLFKTPQNQHNPKTLIIINPPYGHRIGEKSEISLSYYVHLIETIKKVYAPERIGIIIPDEYNFRPQKDDLLQSYSFKNGGIPVTFFIFSALSH